MINRFTKLINDMSTILFKLKDVKQSLEYLCDGSSSNLKKFTVKLQLTQLKIMLCGGNKSLCLHKRGTVWTLRRKNIQKKWNVLLELPELLSAITIKCAAQTAAKE